MTNLVEHNHRALVLSGPHPERDVAVIRRQGVGDVVVGTTSVRSGGQTVAQAISAKKLDCK
jgi:hypothetical protein